MPDSLHFFAPDLDDTEYRFDEWVKPAIERVDWNELLSGDVPPEADDD